MKGFVLRAATLFLLLAFTVVSGTTAAAQPVRATSYNDTKGEGKALVQEILTRVPIEDSQILGLLKIRPPEGNIIEVPIRMTVRTVDRGWDDVYETQPVNGRVGEVFIVKHRGTNANEYLFGTYKTPEEKPELKKLSAEELYRPLAGTDFNLFELGLEFLHWPAQKIVKKEMRKSRSCRVVESVNPNVKPGAYARVLSWIDFETSGIILAEAYDHNNKPLKEFSIQKFDRKEKRLREMRILNDQTESSTRLELNFKVE
ncbi:MAG: outer membrane lipoprotein-sorting protein [Limisphaerales bacterium]